MTARPRTNTHASFGNAPVAWTEDQGGGLARQSLVIDSVTVPRMVIPGDAAPAAFILPLTLLVTMFDRRMPVSRLMTYVPSPLRSKSNAVLPCPSGDPESLTIPPAVVDVNVADRPRASLSTETSVNRVSPVSFIAAAPGTGSGSVKSIGAVVVSPTASAAAGRSPSIDPINCLNMSSGRPSGIP